MLVFTDVTRIHHILQMQDVYIASPLGEFWTDADFKQEVEIQLPHCLYNADDLSSLQVLRISTKGTGETRVEHLSNMGSSRSHNRPRTHVEVQSRAQFHMSNNKIHVYTRGFSAYVVVTCRRNEPRDLYVMGCGSNEPDDSMCRNGSIRICVWDERLKLTDNKPVR